MRSIISLAALVSVVAFALPARAQNDFVGARAMGMGEAQRATATGASGPLHEPRRHVAGPAVRDRGHVRHQGRDSRPPRQPLGGRLDHRARRRRPVLQLHLRDAEARLQLGGRHRSTRSRSRAPATPPACRCRCRSAIASSSARPRSTCTSTPRRRCRWAPCPITSRSTAVNGVTFDVGMIVRLGDHFNIGAHRLQLVGSRQPRVAAVARRRPAPTCRCRRLSINFDTVINFTGYQNYKVDMMTGKVDPRPADDGAPRPGHRVGRGQQGADPRRRGLRLGPARDLPDPRARATCRPPSASTSSYRTKVQGGIENFLMLGLRIFID